MDIVIINYMKAYIDESGTLPDPNDKFIVLSAVVTKNSNLLLNKIREIKNKSKRGKRFNGELKYYTASDRLKGLFFKTIKTIDITMFILVISKQGLSIKDNPLNFSILSSLLVSSVNKRIPKCRHFIFDKHFSNKNDLKEFNSNLLSTHGQIVIEHVESYKNIAVNFADMIAGCTLANFTKKDTRYFKTIEEKITELTMKSWKDVKDDYQKKTCLNRCKHPSKQVN